MLTALVDLPTYQSAHHLSDTDYLYIADINGDHVVNNADIQALLYLLMHPPGGSQLPPSMSDAPSNELPAAPADLVAEESPVSDSIALPLEVVATAAAMPEPVASVESTDLVPTVAITVPDVQVQSATLAFNRLAHPAPKSAFTAPEFAPMLVSDAKPEEPIAIKSPAILQQRNGRQPRFTSITRRRSHRRSGNPSLPTRLVSRANRRRIARRRTSTSPLGPPFFLSNAPALLKVEAFLGGRALYRGRQIRPPVDSIVAGQNHAAQLIASTPILSGRLPSGSLVFRPTRFVRRRACRTNPARAIHQNDPALPSRLLLPMPRHAKEESGKLDLSTFASVDDVTNSLRRWETVLKRVEASEMPPDDAKRQPTAEARTENHRVDPRGPQAGNRSPRRRPRPGARPPAEQRRVRLHHPRPHRRRHPADPGVPVDPANEAGFDNSGESLAMSPALLKKYLEAARRVADHVVLKPRPRLRAAPGRHRHRPRQVLRQPNHRLLPAAADRLRRLLPRRLAIRTARLGQPDATLADFAATGKSARSISKRSGRSLDRRRTSARSPALKRCGASCRPARQTDAGQPREKILTRFASTALDLREKLVPKGRTFSSRNRRGSQPFVLWKTQLATHRRAVLTPSCIEGDASRPPDSNRQSRTARVPQRQ